MDLKDVGDDSGLVFYAVSIDASKADVGAMDGVLSKLDSVPNGLVISSDAGLATLAAFINETERGLIVLPNFVMNPDAIADRVATEAPVASGPHSGDYTPTRSRGLTCSRAER